jgi:hypothetical protein
MPIRHGLLATVQLIRNRAVREGRTW